MCMFMTDSHAMRSQACILDWVALENHFAVTPFQIIAAGLGSAWIFF